MPSIRIICDGVGTTPITLSSFTNDSQSMQPDSVYVFVLLCDILYRVDFSQLVEEGDI